MPCKISGMTSPSPWDPGQYERYRGPRTRPLHDLLARIPPLPGPAPRIADLGCGPGRPTALLAERWPDALITGLDNSPEMLAEAAAFAGPTPGGGSVSFARADIGAWEPDPDDPPFDLILANAALQWVPGHTSRFPAWLSGLTSGGVLAFQVPGNFGAPSHRLLRELCASPRWRDRLGGVLRHERAVLEPAGYVAALAPLGCDLDVWETTYLHLLPGADPVLEWVKGTGLRPVLAALEDDPAAREAFLAEYGEALRAAYPPGPSGTVFPFRRIFVVARQR
jgi:trans-aconitate 2-methyltransferase